jgi:hypothetical protein
MAFPRRSFFFIDNTCKVAMCKSEEGVRAKAYTVDCAYSNLLSGPWSFHHASLSASGSSCRGCATGSVSLSRGRLARRVLVHLTCTSWVCVCDPPPAYHGGCSQC